MEDFKMIEEGNPQDEPKSILELVDKKLSNETGLPIKGHNPNSIIGMAYEKSKDPSLLLPRTPSRNPSYDPLGMSAATIDLTNAYTDPLSNYGSYGVPLSPFADFNEERAQRQSTGEKWVRGLTKAGITLGTAFAENTVGLMAGLGNLAFGENHSFVDNPFGRAMDDINEWARETMPNYYTKAEEKAGLLEGLGSANFWADKVAGGAAYTVGSIASFFVGTGEAALISNLLKTGKYTKLAGSLSKLNNLDEAVKATSNSLGAYRAAKLVGKTDDIVGITSKVSRAANIRTGVRNFTVATQMSLAEASIEAREAKNRFIEDRIAEWENTTGKDKSELDLATLKSFEESGEAAGNLTFAINLPILVTTNAITFGKMFKSGKPLAEGLTNRVSRDASGKWVEGVANSGFKKALQKSGRILGSKPIMGAGSEMFQEGAQFLGSELSREYYADKYQDGVGDMAEAFNKGLSKTFGTKEGLESMFIGAIIGGGTGTLSRMFGADKKFAKEKNANTQKLINFLNNGGITKAIENLDKSEYDISLINGMDNALKNGDLYTADKYRNRLILSVAEQARKFGGLDSIYEQLEDLRKDNDLNFMNSFGYDTTKTLEEQTGKNKNQLIDEIKSKIEKFTTVRENIESIMAERQVSKQLIPSLIDKLFETEEIKKAKVLENKIFSNYANMLLNRVVDIDGIDQRISEKYDELVKIFPNFAVLAKEDFEFFIKAGEMQYKDGEIVLTNNIKEGKNKRSKAAIEFQDVMNAALKANSADVLIGLSKVFGDLKNMIVDREVANTSLKKMLASPNEMAQMVEDEILSELIESRKKNNEEAQKVLENSATSSEIEEISPNVLENTSEDIKKQLEDKWWALRDIEDTLYKKFMDMPDDEFNKINENDFDDNNNQNLSKLQEREAYLRAKANREKNKKDPKKITLENDPNVQNLNKSVDFTDIQNRTFGEVFLINNSGGIFLSVAGRDYANYSGNYGLDALVYDETGEYDGVIGIRLTDLETGNDVTWKLADENKIGGLTESEAKDNAIAEALIYFTLISVSSENTSNIEIENKESMSKKEIAETYTEEILPIKEKSISENFEGATGQKVAATQEELAQYAKDNIEKSASMTDTQLRVQIEQIRQVRGEIANEIAQMRNVANSEDYNKKQFEFLYSEELTYLKALDRRLSRMERYKIQILSSRRNVEKEKVLNTEIKEEGNVNKLTKEERDILILNIDNEINALNEELVKVNDRISKFELLPNLKSQRAFKDLNDRVKVITNRIKTKEEYRSYIQSLEYETKPTTSAEDSNAPQGTGESTEGQEPTAENILTAEAPQTEGIHESGNAGIISEEEAQKLREQTETEIKSLEALIEEDKNKNNTQTPPPIKEGEQPKITVNAELGESLNVDLSKGGVQATIGTGWRMVVTDEGEVLFNDDIQQTTLDGEKIPVDHQAVASNNVIPIGTTVRFELKEDTEWWDKNKDSYPEAWHAVPIYVIAETADGDVRLPLLQAFDPETKRGESRKVIYELLKRGLTPTAVITSKKFDNTNFRNSVVRTEEGFSPYFHNLLNSFTQEYIKDNLVYVGFKKDSGITFKGPGAENNNIDAVDTSNLLLGQVGLVVDRPDGSKTVIILKTRNIKDSEEAIIASINSLKNGDLINFQNIVGLNIIPNLDSENLPIDDEEAVEDFKEDLKSKEEVKKFMMVQTLNNGVNLLTFYSATAKRYIRISDKELKDALEGKRAMFSFVEMGTNEKGYLDIKIVSSNDNTLRDNVISNLEKDLRTAISLKKFQVDIKGKLTSTDSFDITLTNEQSYDTYLDYILSENSLGTPSEGNGSNSILSTDISADSNMSVFHNVGVELTKLSTKEGDLESKKNINSSVIPGVKPNTPTTTPAPTTSVTPAPTTQTAPKTSITQSDIESFADTYNTQTQISSMSFAWVTPDSVSRGGVFERNGVLYWDYTKTPGVYTPLNDRERALFENYFKVVKFLSNKFNNMIKEVAAKNNISEKEAYIKIIDGVESNKNNFDRFSKYGFTDEEIKVMKASKGLHGKEGYIASLDTDLWALYSYALQLGNQPLKGKLASETANTYQEAFEQSPFYKIIKDAELAALGQSAPQVTTIDEFGFSNLGNIGNQGLAIMEADLNKNGIHTIYSKGATDAQLAKIENDIKLLQSKYNIRVVRGTSGRGPRIDIKLSPQIGIAYTLRNQQISVDHPEGETSVPIIDYQNATAESYEGTKIKVTATTTNTVTAEITYPDGESFTDTFDKKDFETKIIVLPSAPQVVTQPTAQPAVKKSFKLSDLSPASEEETKKALAEESKSAKAEEALYQEALMNQEEAKEIEKTCENQAAPITKFTGSKLNNNMFK
jgi:hypothetical protein